MLEFPSCCLAKKDGAASSNIRGQKSWKTHGASQEHKKCRKVLKNVTLPTKCPLTLRRSGKDSLGLATRTVTGSMIKIGTVFQSLSRMLRMMLFHKEKCPVFQDFCIHVRLTMLQKHRSLEIRNIAMEAWEPRAKR